MKTTVCREADRVWLEGVHGWFCGEKESSVHAAEEVMMKAAGEAVTYDYLVGVSGLAFRMQLSKEGFCGSSPHACCGYACVRRAVEALPRALRIYEVKADNQAGVAEARQAVVDSIERGIPVQYGCEEDGVIVGYGQGGAQWLCLHPYRHGGKQTFIETDWPWGLAVVGESKLSVRSRAGLAAEAIRQAVDMARLDQFEGYYLGFRAWEEYLARLRALDEVDDTLRQGAMQGNAWIYECLAMYRGIAARYLREVAGLFQAPVTTRLERAANLYEQMSTQVLTDANHCVVTVAPYPWALTHGKTWTPTLRRKQVRRLEVALTLEREAIGELTQALSLLDSPATGKAG